MAPILRKAERRQAKLRLGLNGPSGSGKTMSALKIARGLASDWNKIAIIDTENGSGELYSHLGDYNVVPLEEFDPKSYVDAIKACEDAGMEVIIIDSITHEWKHVLETVDQIARDSASKNSYTAWAKATPLHDSFIQAILKSKCHVITTVRSKQDYDMSKDDKGKTVVTKVGMKQETRDGFEYELTVSLDLSITHLATASKDRTTLFADSLGFKITEETGRKLKEWNESGVDPNAHRESLAALVQEEIDSASDLESLRTAYEHAVSVSKEIGKERSDVLAASVKSKKAIIEANSQKSDEKAPENAESGSLDHAPSQDG